jgi:Dolichyl-phosphate-mannose-protein mannosyltransferase
VSRSSRSALTGSRAIAAGFVLVLCLRLLLFSQRGTSAWSDEGVFLLAAQLINAGRRPYFDFHCPHPPTYFYLVAWWMRVFGQSWRAAHVFSALLSGGAIALVAGYVLSRRSECPWRLAAALLAAALMGLHPIVLRAGVIGQYYGLLMLLIVGAYWLTVAAIDRSARFTVLPGLITGAALSTSFLSAPIFPILLIWTAARASASERWKRSGWFLTGTAIPLIPLFWMAAHGFSYVVYNVFLYQVLYRSLGFWEHADITAWNLKVLRDWIVSPWNFFPVLCALAGYLLISSNSRAMRHERRLCGWLAAGLAIYLALPRPTFLQYFVVVTPFLSILAAFAVADLGASVWASPSPYWSLGAVALFVCVWAARYRSHPTLPVLRSGDWREAEMVAREVNHVTAPGAPIYANEDWIYFAAGRNPPPGLEHSFARDRKVPPQAAMLLHFTPQEQFDRWLAEGRYDTVVVTADSGEARRVDLNSIYRENSTIGDYIIFWDRTPHHSR